MTARPVSIPSTRERLILRSPKVSDAQNLLDRALDPLCVQYLPHLNHKNHKLSGNEARIRQWREGSCVESLFLVIERVSDGKLIGDCGYVSGKPIGSLDADGKRTGDCGVMLNSSEDVRGHGYAVEAMETQIKFGFEELDLERITVGTLKVNAPMRGIMEKQFGLQPIEKEDEQGISCIYTLDKADWEKSASKQ